MAEESLNYAFTWLTKENGAMFELVKQQVQAANPVLGAIEFENFKGITEFPQGFASAWSKAQEITGATYVPLLCVGKQVVKGINYWFIAYQTTATATPTKHIVTIAINEFNGNYTPVNGSIVRIF